MTLAPERVVLTTELPGRTSAYLVAEIRPQVNGIIQQRRFEEGARRQGRRACSTRSTRRSTRRRSTRPQAALAVAEANLPAARSRAERLKGLVAIRAVGQQDCDDAAAALAAGRGQRGGEPGGAGERPHQPRLHADQGADLGAHRPSSVTVGALVTAYQPVPLAVIQQLDPIYVDVTQSSADLLRLRRALESGELRRDERGPAAR